MRPIRYGPAIYFRGSSASGLETAAYHTISFGSGEPYTLALLIRWTENPGTESIFRSGSSSDGNWLWMTSSGKFRGRHANVDNPSSGNAPIIAAGWHTLARVWTGQEIRQHVEWIAHQHHAVTATGSWAIYRWGWQFSGSEGLDEAYVPFFGAFGAAWDDGMVARWGANPLGMLWPERDAPFLGSERVVQVRRQDRSGRWSSIAAG